MAVLLTVASEHACGQQRFRETTSFGNVAGNIYDAQTGAPLAGATVQVRTPQGFEEKGKSAGVTDKYGRYRVQALIGRVSQHFDVGRALSSGLIGVLVGGSTTRTKRLDVTRLDMRVTAPGYKPFMGIVPCRELDAVRFTVKMSPIVLVPQGVTGSSAVVERWGSIRLKDTQVAPTVVRAGETVNLSAVVDLPNGVSSKDVEVFALADVWGRKRLVAQRSGPNGSTLFTSTVKAPRVRSSTSVRVLFSITKAPLDMAAASSSQRYLEIVGADSDVMRAEKRAEAYAAVIAGRLPRAFALMRELAADASGSERDLMALGEVASAMGDYQEAADAFEKALARTERGQRAALSVQHAEALLRAGNAQKVIEMYGGILADNPSLDARRALSPRLLVVLGEAYLVTGDIAGAGRVVDRLNKEPGRLPPRAARLRSAVRLAEARDSFKSHPEDVSKQVALARALLDVGRWEEGIAVLGDAVQRTSAPPAAAVELQYALTRFGTSESRRVSQSDLSLDAARRAVRINEGKKERKSKDFYAWHALAMLLYSRYCELDGPEKESVLDECLEALQEAVACGRAGAVVDEGLYAPYSGYILPQVVAVTGYAYPEAASDYVLWTRLRELRNQPDEPFALLNVAAALVDLRHEKAQLALEKARPAWEGTPDYVFLWAVAAVQAGDRGTAVQRLREVITLHPFHARAYSLLASLLTELGDSVGAAQILAEQAERFGERLELRTRED